MPTGETIRIELPAQYRYLNIIGVTIRALLERYPEPVLSAGTIYQLQLAVHEICNNIVEHAYGHEDGDLQVELTVPEDHHALIIDLYDAGKAFDPELITEPDLSEPQVKGYGMFLAHQILDEILYRANTGRNHWHLVKYLGP